MKTRAAACLFILFLSFGAMAESQPVRHCRSIVQGRIDVLDAELHKGDKPDAARKLVKRRDRLKSQLQRCTENPDAYKRDI